MGGFQESGRKEMGAHMQAYMEERASESGLIKVTGINMIKEHK